MKHQTLNVKSIKFRFNEKLQYFVGVFLFVILSIFISSCATSIYSQAEVDKYFTQESAKAKTSPILLQIPKGWHVIDANNEAFIDLLFVRNDLNLTLSLLPFYSNSTSNNLEKNCETSILLQQAKHKNKLEIKKEIPTEIGDKKVLTYSFSIDGKNYRIMLFEHNEKQYELTLFGSKNIEIEYYLQELVIFSAK